MDTFQDARRAEKEMIEAYRVMEEEEVSIVEDSERIRVGMKAASTMANRLAQPPLTL